MRNNRSPRAIRLAKARQARTFGVGDARSFFYGDPVVIEPADVAEVIVNKEDPEVAITAAVADKGVSESDALQKIQAYQSMSLAERGAATQVPPLACWNAMVLVNPLLGAVSVSALNYNLQKTLNEFPFQGQVFHGVPMTEWNRQGVKVTISVPDSVSDPATYAVPFCRFTITASSLNSKPGEPINISFAGVDSSGRRFDTTGAIGDQVNTNAQYRYSIQRISSVEAVYGVFIPFQVIATRTLPFLPVFGGPERNTLVIYFENLDPETTSVTVTVPGYATAELREVAEMYQLPAGMVR